MNNKYSLIDLAFDVLEKTLEESIDVAFKNLHEKELKKDKVRELRMWEARVKFITELKQWETRTFRRLLATENTEGLVVEASSLLFDKVATLQSSYIDVWRTAVRHDKPFRQVEREKDVRIPHPDNFKSPDRFAQYVLKETQNAS